MHNNGAKSIIFSRVGMSMYTVGMIDIKDRECLQLSTMVIYFKNFLKKHRDVIFDGF